MRYFPLLTGILMVVSCGDESVNPEALYSGVWTGPAGDDTLVFRFNLPGEDCPGVIHCINEGKQYSEMPMSTVIWEPPILEVHMAATGVTYSGVLREGMIEGRIGDLPLNLEASDPSAIPGLAAVEGNYVYFPPESVADGIAAGSLPAGTAEELVERISSGDAGLVHSVLIWSEGELVFEEYFHGYTVDDLHRLMSCTKSVASLLTGIALDNGMIDSVSVPLSSFFSGFPEGITLEHLLTMSMGLNWTDEESELVHRTGDAFFSEVSEMDQAVEPGTAFRYVNSDVNLLSGVIHRVSGMYPDRFAEEYLFGPLGISDYDWSYGETNGHRLMDGSLHLRPRDMLKIGVMVLQDGSWNGDRVVSPEWVSASVSPHIAVDEIFDYGYLWWLTDTYGTEVYLASGWGSQFIAVIPEFDTVIVTTGGNDDTGKNWEVLRVVWEVLFGQRL